MALVYDPLTGTLVDDGRGVPGNPARANAMQAQFNQPVTGPRGVVGATPTTAVNPNAINVGGAAADVLLGGLSTIPAAIADAAAVGATQLLGGDPATLPGGAYARTSAATNRVGQGLGALGQANSQLVDSVQGSLLGALGASPAVPAPAVPQPVVAPAEQVDAVQQPTPVAGQPALLDVGPINAQIAASLASLRPQAAPQAAAERGNYNTQNTDLAALRQRAAPTNGINFGFGVNGSETARQYLDRMSAVDQQRNDQRELGNLRREAQLARSSLSSQSSAGEIYAARQQLAAIAPQIASLTGNQGALAQTNARNRSDLAVAGLQNQGAMDRARLAGQFGLAQADLTGQYGLGAAGLRAQGTVAAQQAKQASPEGQASLAQARLRELQLALAQSALERGDPTQAAALAAGRAVPTQRIAEDMLGNPIGTYDAQGNLIPYTPEQIARYREVSGLAQGR